VFDSGRTAPSPLLPMFESTIASTRKTPVTTSFYGFTTAPILHGAVVAFAIVQALVTVEFPDKAPNQMIGFRVDAEPPSPPPPPPPPAAPVRSVTPKQKVKATETFAPTRIPDEIPQTTPELQSDAATDDGIAGGVEGGVAGGLVGGVMGGQVGGTMDGVVGGVNEQPPPRKLGDPIIVERDRALPLKALSQVYPLYPEEMRIRRRESSCVVRYVIGKNGRVREATLLRASVEKAFNDSAVSAIRSWRFRPLVVGGEPVEVVHELTIYFRLEAS